MDGQDVKSNVLRVILKNFSNLVSRKGTDYAICGAVYVFLKAYNICTQTTIYRDNDTHEIWIGINNSVIDISVLETVLKYLVPTGYITHIYFYEDVNIRMGFRFKSTMQYIKELNTATNNIYWI